MNHTLGINCVNSQTNGNWDHCLITLVFQNNFQLFTNTKVSVELDIAYGITTKRLLGSIVLRTFLALVTECTEDVITKSFHTYARLCRGKRQTMLIGFLSEHITGRTGQVRTQVTTRINLVQQLDDVDTCNWNTDCDCLGVIPGKNRSQCLQDVRSIRLVTNRFLKKNHRLNTSNRRIFHQVIAGSAGEPLTETRCQKRHRIKRG